MPVRIRPFIDFDQTMAAAGNPFPSTRMRAGGCGHYDTLISPIAKPAVHRQHLPICSIILLTCLLRPRGEYAMESTSRESLACAARS